MSENVSVIRKVLVKSVVTKKLKEILTKEVQMNLDNLNADFSRFTEQREMYIKQCREQDVKPDYEIMKKMAIEEEKFKASKAQGEHRMAEINGLAEGVEYTHGTVDSTVSVNVGDNWHSIMTGMEILLDDGIVKEVRKKDVTI